jgi:hypothetical protein
MMPRMAVEAALDRRRLPSRKAITVSAWGARYEELALTGVRSREVTERIALHLRRFGEYLSVTYGHERLTSVVRRDVVGWRDALVLSASARRRSTIIWRRCRGSAAGCWPGHRTRCPAEIRPAVSGRSLSAA